MTELIRLDINFYLGIPNRNSGLLIGTEGLSSFTWAQDSTTLTYQYDKQAIGVREMAPVYQGTTACKFCQY